MTTPADREAFLREEIKKVEAEKEQLKLELAQANDADKATIRQVLLALNRQGAAFAESYAALGIPQMRIVRACAHHGLAACHSPSAPCWPASHTLDHAISDQRTACYTLLRFGINACTGPSLVATTAQSAAATGTPQSGIEHAMMSHGGALARPLCSFSRRPVSTHLFLLKRGNAVLQVLTALVSQRSA